MHAARLRPRQRAGREHSRDPVAGLARWSCRRSGRARGSISLGQRITDGTDPSVLLPSELRTVRSARCGRPRGYGTVQFVGGFFILDQDPSAPAVTPPRFSQRACEGVRPRRPPMISRASPFGRANLREAPRGSWPRGPISIEKSRGLGACVDASAPGAGRPHRRHLILPSCEESNTRPPPPRPGARRDGRWGRAARRGARAARAGSAACTPPRAARAPPARPRPLDTRAPRARGWRAPPPRPQPHGSRAHARSRRPHAARTQPCRLRWVSRASAASAASSAARRARVRAWTWSP